MKNKRKKIKILFLLLIIQFISIYGLVAQEIECNVIVNIEQIEQENRYKISSLENDIKNYINTQRFTNLQWEGDRIPVDINVFVAGGYNNKFSAQIFIAAKRNLYGKDGGRSITLRFFDKQWVFEYNQGAMLSFNTSRYNDVASLLDYYMLLIIGFDMDTYEELSGTRVYEQSKQVVTMAASYGIDGYETNAEPGKFTRYSLVSELTDIRFEPLRKLIFSYYVDGLDMMSQNRENAIDNLAYVIQEMAEFKRKKLSMPSTLITAFFDAKAEELADIFKGYTKYKSVFQDLKFLDPVNANKYQDAADYEGKK